ncbi:MAG: polyketide synthase dehydratase domain-containing protein, partial [Chloroflexi bacterium]|nr:polyketide synthase dehydratase domain-containing protein [Chloroflexota bacterium]
QRIQVDVASHSPQVDCLQTELTQALGDLELRPTSVGMQSTVSGLRVHGHELDARYWVRNLREPVRFAEVLAGLIAEGYRRFVEIGPNGVLIGAIHECLGNERGVAVASLRRGEHDRASLQQGLARLYASGVTPAWERVNGPVQHPVVLPPYAWQRERHWLWDETTAPARRVKGRLDVGGERELHVWQLEPEAGHRVAGREILAGGTYVEAALRGAAEVNDGGAWEVRDVEWTAILDHGRTAQLVLDQDRFSVTSRGDGESAWLLNGRAKLVRGDPEPRRLDLAAIRRRCPRAVSESDFYERLGRQGLEYADIYRQVREAWLGRNEAVARVESAKLDACMQTVSLAAGWCGGQVRVPVRARRIALGSGFDGEVWAWAQWRETDADVVVLDPTGNVVAEIDGLELKRLGSTHAGWLWSLAWQVAPRNDIEPEPLSGHWLIIGPEAADLAFRLKARGAECVVGAGPDALESRSGWSGVVWSAAENDTDDLNQVVELIQRTLRHGWRDPPRLWLVTRGTQAAGTGVEATRGAGLWGLGRTLMYEHPELRVRLVDATSDLDDVAAEVACGSGEDQVALRPEARYVARLQPLVDVDRHYSPERPAGAQPFRLQQDHPGTLDGLTWRAMERRKPGSGEVEVEVMATGLNFLDALGALGRYPGQSTGPATLGREFAGEIVAVGEGVDDFRVGDAVVGCADASLASHVVASAAAVARKPPTLTWVAAAGQVVAFA